MEKLTPEEIAHLHRNNLGLDWVVDDQLTINLSLDSEKAVNSLLNQMDALAQLQKHHPDVAVDGLKVTISLTTHDAPGITARDFRYAEALEKYLNS